MKEDGKAVIAAIIVGVAGFFIGNSIRPTPKPQPAPLIGPDVIPYPPCPVNPDEPDRPCPGPGPCPNPRPRP